MLLCQFIKAVIFDDPEYDQGLKILMNTPQMQLGALDPFSNADRQLKVGVYLDLFLIAQDLSLLTQNSKGSENDHEVAKRLTKEFLNVITEESQPGGRIPNLGLLQVC